MLKLKAPSRSNYFRSQLTIPPTRRGKTPSQGMMSYFPTYVFTLCSLSADDDYDYDDDGMIIKFSSSFFLSVQQGSIHHWCWWCRLREGFCRGGIPRSAKHAENAHQYRNKVFSTSFSFLTFKEIHIEFDLVVARGVTHLDSGLPLSLMNFCFWSTFWGDDLLWTIEFYGIPKRFRILFTFHVTSTSL